MEVINAIGRRKSSVARIYMTEGTGKITINKKDLTEYFPSAILQYVVKQPLNRRWWFHRSESGFAPCYCPRPRKGEC